MITRHLPVRSCRVVDSSGMTETHHTVQCPRREESAPFERCCGCEHMKSIDVAPDGKSGTVECVMNGLPASAKRARVDVAEAAARVRLGEILGTETTCVRPDVRLRDVTALLTGQARRAVPVVDESRRLVGIVSRSDLLSKKRGERRKPLTVADIMTPVVHGLPEQAPVAYAISLMGLEGLHEVPIVDDKGHVIGMITAVEALRWVAGALGYVVPGASSRDV